MAWPVVEVAGIGCVLFVLMRKALLLAAVTWNQTNELVSFMYGTLVDVLPVEIDDG